MEPYIHKIHYYETDKMGITHHSNYVRFMEEARTDYLEKQGYGYTKFESEGITSPVLAVECHYHRSTTFDDEICITVAVEQYTGVKVTFRYTMTDEKSDKPLFTGKTEHCFIDKNGSPVIVRKKYPLLDALLKSLAAKDGEPV